MTSTYRLISLGSLDGQGLQVTAPPSLASLRLGLLMLFCGMMLTLSVTFSLAAQVPPRDGGPMHGRIDAPIDAPLAAAGDRSSAGTVPARR